MLGSASEAEDAVQETWLRLTRSDVSGVANLGGWLTTVIARVCLDMLRARKTRRSSPIDDRARGDADPTRDTMIADSLGTALLVVLETLSPAERVAFVLHDMFDLSFDEIGRVLDRTEAATRQLASRARRRVQGREPGGEGGRATRQVVDAFLQASRAGDFDALLALLDPDVVVRADERAVETAQQTKWSPLARETRGAAAVATLFKGRAGGASRATIDGDAGAAWAVKGHVRTAFMFTIAGGKIVALDLVMEPSALAELDVVLDAI